MWIVTKYTIGFVYPQDYEAERAFKESNDMDAVTYLKTYERMREAEGLYPFESLFKAGTSAEEKVSLVEEWGKENPDKPIIDNSTTPEEELKILGDIVANMNKRLLLVEVAIENFDEALQDLEI